MGESLFKIVSELTNKVGKNINLVRYDEKMENIDCKNADGKHWDCIHLWGAQSHQRRDCFSPLVPYCFTLIVVLLIKVEMG